MGDSHVSDVLTPIFILPNHVEDGLGGGGVEGGDTLLTLDRGSDPGAEPGGEVGRYGVVPGQNVPACFAGRRVDAMGVK